MSSEKNCDNCGHRKADHAVAGCTYCGCPYEFSKAEAGPKPVNPEMESIVEKCRCCGHSKRWHAFDPPVKPGVFGCGRCDRCDGFVRQGYARIDQCPARYMKAAPNYQCRRKAGHDGTHSDGAFEWVNHTPEVEEMAANPAERPTGVKGVSYVRPDHRVSPDRVKVADTQVGGEHYRQTGIQPWDIIDAWGLDFYAGNALKYLYRAGRKGPKAEDLKKARHYIDKMIEKEENGG